MTERPSSSLLNKAHDPTIEDRIRAARLAQAKWAMSPWAKRVEILRCLRNELAASAADIAESVSTPYRRSVTETLTSEVLPLADACRFLERNLEKILRPRRLSISGRPTWLWGVQAEIRREPFGVVLVIGPSNYPLFLPGVQSLQALMAGNAVFIKPAETGRECANYLGGLLQTAGLDMRLFQVLGESPADAKAAIEARVDKVVLTGSAATGRTVLNDLAPKLIPAVMELSGADPVFVLEDADLSLVVRALCFGLEWNRAATCIAPRRVFVPRRIYLDLESQLAGPIRELEPSPLDLRTEALVRELIQDALDHGARVIAGGTPTNGEMKPVVIAGSSVEMRLLREEVFAPILTLVSVANLDEALSLNENCPYGLGASIFGSERAAQHLAKKICAGMVVINDVIVPTADPRLPFAGRGHSGFGVTRAAEGLLEMTTVKAVTMRRGRWRPHLEEGPTMSISFFLNYITAAHAAPFSNRLKAGWLMMRELIGRGKNCNRSVRE